MKNMQLSTLMFWLTGTRAIFFFLFVLCGTAHALDVEVQINDGKTISGTLSEFVNIETEFGSQKIPSSMIEGIHGGKESPRSAKTWESIYTLDGLFAAKGNESDKDGFFKVPENGGVINTGIGIIGRLPKNDVSEIKIEFYGAHFAGSKGSGYLKIEFFDRGNKRITGTNFDIYNMINDWRIYKLKDHLKKYEKIISLRKQTVAQIKLIAHPGNWAIVVRSLEIKAR